MNQLTYLLRLIVPLLAGSIYSTSALAIDNFHCKQATCQEFHYVSDQRHTRRSFQSPIGIISFEGLEKLRSPSRLCDHVLRHGSRPPEHSSQVRQVPQRDDEEDQR